MGVYLFLHSLVYFCYLVVYSFLINFFSWVRFSTVYGLVMLKAASESRVFTARLISSLATVGPFGALQTLITSSVQLSVCVPGVQGNHSPGSQGAVGDARNGELRTSVERKPPAL